MARNLNDYEFLQCEDGIYFARPLKNGSISSDARKIEKEEIINLFAEVLQDYCLMTGRPMTIERDGRPFIQATLIME